MCALKRFAIISDIHSNIEALEAVLADAHDQHVDEFICLGDVIGYNASPRACIDRIRSLKCKVVQGNHDFYCSDPNVNLEDFQQNAAIVIDWTRRQISEDERDWLHNLPLSLKTSGFTIVHSSLDNPQSFRYTFDPRDAIDNFNEQKTRVCFHGHTHVPCIFNCKGGSVTKYNATSCSLDPSSGNYFINVGSVGQPRDGIPKACYVIFTMDGLTKLSVEYRRVDYDIEAAVKKIEAAGLPERLITRLYNGQ